MGTEMPARNVASEAWLNARPRCDSVVDSWREPLKNGFIASAIALAALLGACNPPAGDQGTTVEAEVADAERFPVPPKRSEPLGTGYYPNPLKGSEKS